MCILFPPRYAISLMLERPPMLCSAQIPSVELQKLRLLRPTTTGHTRCNGSYGGCQGSCCRRRWCRRGRRPEEKAPSPWGRHHPVVCESAATREAAARGENVRPLSHHTPPLLPFIPFVSVIFLILCLMMKHLITLYSLCSTVLLLLLLSSVLSIIQYLFFVLPRCNEQTIIAVRLGHS